MPETEAPPAPAVAEQSTQTPAAPPPQPEPTPQQAPPPPATEAPDPKPLVPESAARKHFRGVLSKDKAPEKSEESKPEAETKEQDKPAAETPEEKEQEKPAESEKSRETADDDDDYDESEPEKSAEPEPDESVKGEEQKKTGPWQLKAKWEKTAKAFEAENAELKERIAKLGDVDALRERAEKAEQSIAEYEKEMKYVDFSKSKQFKEEFAQPYESAWQQAATELQELRVETEDGESRQATVEDLYSIIQMPLGEARKNAKAMFGDSAEDVMAHRRSIIDLAKKQETALKDAREQGVERDKVRNEAITKARQATQQLWSDYNKKDETKQSFLQQKEGDDEWNSRLKKARDLVDGSMGKSGNDPRLSAEERAAIVRKHASIRGRAIGFSMLKLENTRLKSELAERDKVIAGYKSSEPGDGEPAKKGEAAADASNAWDRARSEIRKRAKRA